MLDRITTIAHRSRDENGLTIIEVLVAAVILAMAAMATFGVLSAATRNGQRAKATQVALDRAQEEIEKLHSLTYKQLAMTVSPAYSANSFSPNHRVVNDTFDLQREPSSEPPATMVVNGGSLYGGGFVEGGVVTPGPIPFEDGDVTGKLYRYVVWRNDASCPESAEASKDFCPGKQDFKQIVVAAKLDTPGNQSGERGYVEVQSQVVNPKSLAASSTGGGGGGKVEEEKEGGSGGGIHTGTAVTAQQFFLSDTPCAASGTTTREEATGDHLLHNTLGVCASGPQTGSTMGAPDALLRGGPPDPEPLDESIPALHDYSNDSYLEPTPDTDKGVQILRDDTGGCHFKPTGAAHPQAQTHRWVTDRLVEDFKMSGTVTLEFYTRTLNDALYHGTLCIYLFGRHEVGPPESPTAFTDSQLKNKVGEAAYWEYFPKGNGFWPRNAWTKVRLTMEFAGAPYTIPAGDRLGVALSVDPVNTDAEAIPIMYDDPKYPSRLEIDTTTPINGG
jgi:type II secretory pathway pseudopilin PulG